MDYEELELLVKRIEQVQARLDRLESERRIAHVMYRYIHACDELKDADVISSLFTEDAIWEGKGRFSEFGQTIGQEAIHEMFVENPIMLPFTAHFLTNPVIGLSMDGTRGWGSGTASKPRPCATGRRRCGSRPGTTTTSSSSAATGRSSTSASRTASSLRTRTVG